MGRIPKYVDKYKYKVRVKSREWDDPKYQEWRKQVLKRDRWKCRWPNCKQPRGKVHVHHIMRWADHPTLRFIVKNGITLCQTHHDFIFGEEVRYAYMLWRLINVSKKHT